MAAKKTKDTIAEKTTAEKTTAVEAVTEEKAAPKKPAAKKTTASVSIPRSGEIWEVRPMRCWTVWVMTISLLRHRVFPHPGVL